MDTSPGIEGFRPTNDGPASWEGSVGQFNSALCISLQRVGQNQLNFVFIPLVQATAIIAVCSSVFELGYENVHIKRNGNFEFIQAGNLFTGAIFRP